MAKTRVLFLCVGNACRSPMAEGFARAYGTDVLTAESAGLAPALGIPPLTYHVMLEKDIALSDHYPKPLEHVEGELDLIVNMSGYDIPELTDTQVEVWQVRDPIGEPEQVYRDVRDEIEQRVLDLIARLRKQATSESLITATGLAKVDSRRRPTRQ